MKKPTVTTPVQMTDDAPKKPTHRYFCDACTGIAFVTNVKFDIRPQTVECRSCGKVQTFKPENLIKL